jgi:hypothetical protein
MEESKSPVVNEGSDDRPWATSTSPLAALQGEGYSAGPSSTQAPKGLPPSENLRIDALTAKRLGREWTRLQRLR